jgi:hypothetical protein
VPKI